MRNLFQRILALATMVIVCVAMFSACHTNEKYEFEFIFPGKVVMNLGETIVVPFTAVNIASMSVSSTPEGWSVESIDLVNSTVTIKAPTSYTADDASVEENGLLRMTGFTAAGTSVYISSYLSLLNQAIDLTQKYSNSYIISQKNTRYTIDATHKGESAERIKPAKVDVLWQTQTYLVDYDGYDPESGIFTFFVGEEDIKDENGDIIDTRVPDGNAVIAAFDERDNIIWTWHLWLTGSDVEQSAITTSAGVFMDRNLGAYANSDGSTDPEKIYESYGLYYQWGRKDPFVLPREYNFNTNRDQYIYTGAGASKLFRYVNAEQVADENRANPFGTMAYAIADPFTYILGNEQTEYDWLYNGHDNGLWSKTKTMNDPCPRGWRVPDADAFLAFDIDAVEDAAASADVKNMYGWHLVDQETGVKMFMPGAGRRSFENGVLTNMNNYGYEHTPMPWIGYYWTVGTTGNKSQSLFFDLNTTRAENNRYEAQKAMYRGNGMQIRCVRE